MEPVVLCIRLKNKKNLPPLEIRKNGSLYEHRSTSQERGNCSVIRIIRILKMNGYVLADAYAATTQGKFGTSICAFYVFSENQNHGLGIDTRKRIEHDLYSLLDASWRVRVQVNTETLGTIISLDARQVPGIYEWAIGDNFDFQEVEEMVKSLAHRGMYKEATILASDAKVPNVSELTTEGLVSLGNTDFPNMHTERRVEAK